MNKKGLSGVVTIILIILLVLVAVGIIWAAVKKPIEETGEKLSADCLTLNVEAVSCNAAGTSVVVTRNAGAGSMTDLKLVFYESADGQGPTNTTICSDETADDCALTELDSTTITVVSPGYTGSFNVAAVTQPGEDPITCEVSNSPVNCE